MSGAAEFGLASGARRRVYTRYSRESQPDPKPNALEIETVHLLLAGESLPDLAIKFGCSRGAINNRLLRMRRMFGAATTEELLGLFLSRGWAVLPRYQSAPACLRSECQSCPVTARLAQLEGSEMKR